MPFDYEYGYFQGDDNMTESALRKLFDYQLFQRNEKLERIIYETKSRYPVELTDDQLGFVAAAGTPDEKKEKDGKLEW